MLCKVVLEAGNDWSVEPFPLAVGMRVIGACHQVFVSQRCRHGCREFGDELQCVIGQ